jgi:hypothetical protein
VSSGPPAAADAGAGAGAEGVCRGTGDKKGAAGGQQEEAMRSIAKRTWSLTRPRSPSGSGVAYASVDSAKEHGPVWNWRIHRARSLPRNLPAGMYIFGQVE